MKILIALLFMGLLFSSTFSQTHKNFKINEFIFLNPYTLTLSEDDSIGTITAPDSVDVQMGLNGDWYLLTQVVSDTAMITTEGKTTGKAVNFNLAEESYWSHVNEIRFRIYNSNESAGVDTVTSYWITVGELYGALVLDVIPDTSGAATHYSKSILHGM